MRKPVPLEIRYERHIRRTRGCWIWEGAANQAGYGQIIVGRVGSPNRQVISVHRWAYEHFVGPIPDGMWVCHRCDNPRCSNPKHLYAGTPTQNASDASTRSRRAKQYKFGARYRKLTDDDVRAIRIDERTLAAIGIAYDVSECHVSNIKRRIRKASVAD